MRNMEELPFVPVRAADESAGAGFLPPAPLDWSQLHNLNIEHNFRTVILGFHSFKHIACFHICAQAADIYCCPRFSISALLGL